MNSNNLAIVCITIMAIATIAGWIITKSVEVPAPINSAISGLVGFLAGVGVGKLLPKDFSATVK